MARIEFRNPNRLIQCDHCTEYDAGIEIRKGGDHSLVASLCGRCLALAMQDITKQNWVSQWTVWRYVSKLGKSLQEIKPKDAIGQSDDQ